MEEDGEAAEEADQEEGKELHLLDFAVTHPAIDELQTGHDDQGAGSRVDVVELVDREENDKWNKFNKLLHVWLIALKNRPQNFVQSTCKVDNGK